MSDNSFFGGFAEVREYDGQQLERELEQAIQDHCPESGIMVKWRPEGAKVWVCNIREGVRDFIQNLLNQVLAKRGQGTFNLGPQDYAYEGSWANDWP